MCFSQPKIPKAPEPIIIPPEQEKRLELNPAAVASASKRKKKLGTRSLQIPLGGTGGGAGGLNTTGI